MDEHQYRIPHYLDEPPRWLFWTLDEAMALMAPLLLGLILFNRVVLGFCLGVVLMLVLKKLKGREGQHFLLSLVYWHFPLGGGVFKATPASYIREYVG